MRVFPSFAKLTAICAVVNAALVVFSVQAQSLTAVSQTEALNSTAFTKIATPIDFWAPVTETTASETVNAEVAASEKSTAATAIEARKSLQINGTYLLSDGPLTVEVLDGMSRVVLRCAAPAAEADNLRVFTPTLAPSTYTVRVLDARGREVQRQRVAYQPR